jgi:hypothetical protein
MDFAKRLDYYNTFFLRKMDTEKVVQKSFVWQKILFLKEIVFLRKPEFIWITITLGSSKNLNLEFIFQI